MTRRYRLLALATGLFVLSGHAAAYSETDLEIGIRQDQFDWNIASDLNGLATPNVAQAVDWSNLTMLQAAVQYSYQSRQSLYFSTQFRYAQNYMGDIRDSRYNGDGQTDEFSRVESKAKEGSVFSARAAIGYRFGSRPRRGRRSFAMIPHVGFSVDDQDLRLTEGRQSLSSPPETTPVGPLTGMDSQYQTKWRGFFAGLNIYSDNGRGRRYFLEYRFHRPDYSAVGKWNLRADLSQPKSFEHTASGKGHALTLGVMLKPRRGWYTKISLNASLFQTHPGLAATFPSSGPAVYTRLNEVNWSSISINMTSSFVY